jgi:hypothetical protein
MSRSRRQLNRTVYVDGVKVVPISLMQALKALSNIYEAKLADKLCQLLHW